MAPRSNCLLFALALWWRRRGRQRYVLIRASRLGLFPHILYGERHHVVHFVPTDKHYKACPPPLFQGSVKWGDE